MTSAPIEDFPALLEIVTNKPSNRRARGFREVTLPKKERKKYKVAGYIYKWFIFVYLFDRMYIHIFVYLYVYLSIYLGKQMVNVMRVIISLFSKPKGKLKIRSLSSWHLWSWRDNVLVPFCTHSMLKMTTPTPFPLSPMHHTPSLCDLTRPSPTSLPKRGKFRHVAMWWHKGWLIQNWRFFGAWFHSQQNIYLH